MSDSIPAPAAVCAPTRADAKRLVRRFASLRAAKRALASSQLENFIDVLDRYGRPIREQLAAFCRDVDAFEAAAAGDAAAADERAERLNHEFSDIESGLRELAREVAESVCNITLAQMRSTLPSVSQRHPVEVTALLDFLLEDESRLPEWAPLIDYLITLLSTSDHGGELCVVRDPATLTPRLSSLTARLQEERGDEAETIRQSFDEALSAGGEHSSLDKTLREMRDRKRNLGLDFFIPAVLRAVVAYNAAMSSRIDSYVDEHRALEKVSGLDEALGVVSALPGEARGTDALQNRAGQQGTECSGGSVFESEGIQQIAAAVARSLTGKPPRHRTPERLVQRLPLDDLNEAEREWVRSVPSEREAEPGAVIGTAILLGLIVSSLPESTLDLLELGIDPEYLQEEWIPEIDGAMKGVIDRRIADNAYDEACILSETKAKFLYAALSAKTRRDREQRATGESRPVAPGTPLSLYDAGLTPDPPTTQRRSSEATKERRWMPRIDRSAVQTAAAIGLLLIASVNFLNGKASTVHYYPEAERASLSTHLDSAYRDGEGRGPLFVGKLNDSWLRLEPKKQLAEARLLIDELDNRGVREVWIFDARNRLQIQARGGKLAHPRPVPEKRRP